MNLEAVAWQKPSPPLIPMKTIVQFLLGVVVLIATIRMFYQFATGTDPESVAKAQKERERQIQEHEEYQREDVRRSFAMKESPVLWNTITELRSQIRSQNEKLGKLKKTFTDLDMNADADDDYRLLVSERDEMVDKLQRVENELNKAYLASVKYEVMQSKAEKHEFERKAAEDGLSEAVQSRVKYETLRKEK